nr:MAG TPA: hypothetical protein [Caudoviricetes sp.]
MEYRLHVVVRLVSKGNDCQRSVYHVRSYVTYRLSMNKATF